MKKLTKQEENWYLFWSRKYTPFVATAYFLTYQVDTPVWTKCGNKLFIPEGGLHGYYVNPDELNNICHKFSKYVLSQNIQIFCNKYENIFRELFKWSIRFNKQDFSKLSAIQLGRLVKGLAIKLISSGEWQMLAFIALEGLVKDAENLLKSQPSLKGFLPALSIPHRETKIMRANLDLLQIAAHPVNLQKKIQKYCSKYIWLNMYEFIDSPLEINEILKHLPDKSSARKGIKNYYENRRKNLKSFQTLLTKVKDRQFRRLLLAANRFSYLKEMRDDYRRPFYLFFRPFWKEISKRTKLSFIETNYLLADELQKALMEPNKKWRALARERLKNFALELSRGKFFIYSDQKSINKLLSRVAINSRRQEISGATAFPGKITGRVKIIYHKDDFRKFAKGNILVTAMTHPEFLPIMRQASAIITDEGGITCHAAITAREMKKPCIIGAKIATKVLKDGDVVEVDANRGRVSKAG